MKDIRMKDLFGTHWQFEKRKGGKGSGRREKTLNNTSIRRVERSDVKVTVCASRV